MAEPFHSPRLSRRLRSLDDPRLDDDLTWEGVHITGDLADSFGDRVEISGSRLTDVRLTGAQLHRLRLIDCVVERCEISGAMLEDSAFQRVEFVDCRMSGVVLTSATMRHVRFSGCRMDHASLRMTTAAPVRFDGCDLTGADFYAATLNGSRIVDCNLTGADFSQASMFGTALHGSDLADLVGGAALRGVRIDSTQIVPLALVVFDSFDIRIDDRPDPASSG
jgi:uncharacterized protein YjbI with pentapeptide repeats